MSDLLDPVYDVVARGSLAWVCAVHEVVCGGDVHLLLVLGDDVGEWFGDVVALFEPGEGLDHVVFPLLVRRLAGVPLGVQEEVAQGSQLGVDVDRPGFVETLGLGWWARWLRDVSLGVCIWPRAPVDIVRHLV